MLSIQASASGTVVKGDFVGSALRELSVSLCKGNGAMFRAGLMVTARCSGRAFKEGDSVPSASTA